MFGAALTFRTVKTTLSPLKFAGACMGTASGVMTTD